MRTARTTALWRDLKREVDDYFLRTGRDRRGGAALYLKAALLVGLAVADKDRGNRREFQAVATSAFAL